MPTGTSVVFGVHEQLSVYTSPIQMNDIHSMIQESLTCRPHHHYVFLWCPITNTGIKYVMQNNSLCVIALSSMAVSRIVLSLFVFLEFLLVCNCGLTREKIRLKRALDDDDIVLGLKMYETKMSQMQTKISAQLAIMQKQKNRIEAIKFYLKRKGEDYEKDDLEGKITFDTDKAKKSLQLDSLDNLVREVDHQETWQRSLLEALKKENEVMDDIHLRVLDNRAICRDTTTEWRDQASGTIRELSRHYVKCNEDELLQRFYLEKKSASEDKVRYNYRCCRLSMKENWERPDGM